MTTLLFDIRPTDPATFALVAATLTLAALAAAVIPAWRATRVSPTGVLRAEQENTMLASGRIALLVRQAGINATRRR